MIIQIIKEYENFIMSEPFEEKSYYTQPDNSKLMKMIRKKIEPVSSSSSKAKFKVLSNPFLNTEHYKEDLKRINLQTEVRESIGTNNSQRLLEGLKKMCADERWIIFKDLYNNNKDLFLLTIVHLNDTLSNNEKIKLYWMLNKDFQSYNVVAENIKINAEEIIWLRLIQMNVMDGNQSLFYFIYKSIFGSGMYFDHKNGKPDVENVAVLHHNCLSVSITREAYYDICLIYFPKLFILILNDTMRFLRKAPPIMHQHDRTLIGRNLFSSIDVSKFILQKSNKNLNYFYKKNGNVINTVNLNYIKKLLLPIRKLNEDKRAARQITKSTGYLLELLDVYLEAGYNINHSRKVLVKLHQHKNNIDYLLKLVEKYDFKPHLIKIGKKTIGDLYPKVKQAYEERRKSIKAELDLYNIPDISNLILEY
jgi:hypothetical protein